MRLHNSSLKKKTQRTSFKEDLKIKLLLNHS